MNTAKVQQLMDEARATQGDAFTALSATADKIVKDAPDSAQAIQTQLLMAKLAYDKADYASAEKALKKVENSKVDDDGLVQIVKLRLAYAQLAQKKFDDSIKTLAQVTDPAFKATADEALGDVYVALVERKQERQILQIKLESVGILVDDPEIERPIIETVAEES